VPLSWYPSVWFAPTKDTRLLLFAQDPVYTRLRQYRQVPLPADGGMRWMKLTQF
jgi:hypothetical protein